MKSMMITIPVEPGITLRAIRTDRFKTGCFSINLLQPHRRETASVDALLPSVLLHGTARYPDITAVTNRLDDLYGATLGTLVRRKGETRFVGFYADFIEDAYILEVSSPGLGRTLKKDKHLEKSLGEEVEIRLYKPVDKCREFTGVLKSYDADSITIDTAEKEMTFARKEIALIRLALDF